MHRVVLAIDRQQLAPGLLCRRHDQLAGGYEHFLVRKRDDLPELHRFVGRFEPDDPDSRRNNDVRRCVRADRQAFLRAHGESPAAAIRLWPSAVPQAHRLSPHPQPTQLPADAARSARPTHPGCRPQPAPQRQIARASPRQRTTFAARSTPSIPKSPICEIPPSTLVKTSAPEQNPIIANHRNRQYQRIDAIQNPAMPRQ